MSRIVARYDARPRHERVALALAPSRHRCGGPLKTTTFFPRVRELADSQGGEFVRRRQCAVTVEVTPAATPAAPAFARKVFLALISRPVRRLVVLWGRPGTGRHEPELADEVDADEVYRVRTEPRPRGSSACPSGRARTRGIDASGGSSSGVGGAERRPSSRRARRDSAGAGTRSQSCG